jgi:hypothetical protein
MGSSENEGIHEVVPSTVFCVTLPLLSYVNVVVETPFAICVTASGLAYAIPLYGYLVLLSQKVAADLN